MSRLKAHSSADILKPDGYMQKLCILHHFMIRIDDGDKKNKKIISPRAFSNIIYPNPHITLFSCVTTYLNKTEVLCSMFQL